MSILNIMGIDPGSRKLGYAILSSHGARKKPRLLIAGTLHPKSLKDKLWVSHLDHLMNQYKPDLVAIEQPYYRWNPRTALRLGQISGICIGLAFKNNIEVREYLPTQIKLICCGSGNCSRQLLRTLITRILNKPVSINDTEEDALDAIATALAGLLDLHSNQQLLNQINESKARS